MGQWPAPVIATVADGELFSAASVLWVNITTPAEGASVTNAAIPVNWAFAPGTQSTSRLRVYSDLALTTLVYDSGTVIGSVLGHTIPEGALDTGGTYYMRVEITTTDGQTGESDTRTFTTSYAPANALAGLRRVVIGHCPDKRGPGPIELPGVRIYWTAPTLVAAEQFLRYSIWRKVLDGTSGWVRIASISTYATVTYFDHTTPLFTPVEYDVTFSVHNTTTNNDLSSPHHATSASMRAVIENDFTYLHDIDDPANYVQFFHFNGDIEPTGDGAQVVFWGATKPVVYVGDVNFRRFVLPGLPDVKRGTVWRDANDLRDAQRESGAVTCLRIGQHGQRAFCAILAIRMRMYQGAEEPEMELVEIEHDEAVS